MTNRTLTAAEALEWGIVNKVVPADRLMPETMALARSLAEGPTRSFGAVKQLANGSFGETLETQMEFEARCIADAARRHDGREGIAAFVGKRKPAFTGE